MSGIKLSELDATTTISGGYFYVILPTGNGTWLPKRVSAATLKSEVTKSNTLTKGFTNDSLDASYNLIITTPACVAIEITIQKPDGTEMLTQGLVKKQSSTQVIVNFGEAITEGQWYYILKYYETTN